MGIKLISEKEHLTVEISGVVFHYRRPTPDSINAMREKHTTRGKVDEDGFANAMLEYCVFNWSGDISMEESGEPAVFEPGLLRVLPMKVKVALVETLADQVDGKHVKADPM